ncbi:MAG TPA: GntR family transcriptional regulator [Acidimicrobiia bacterium]|nr:GntR family transcriptional regulator [Acidimicrobiia bacterium]
MSPHRSRHTADGIYEELRDRICLLQIPPGAQLREQSLAEEFGVSRTPVREALTMLRVDGLVSRQRGGGTSVSTVDLKHMRDVYSLRIKLAELIADFMIVPVPAGIVARLRELRAEVEPMRAERDARRLGGLYNRFHETLLETIGNEPLKIVSDRLFRQTCRVWIQLLPEMNWEEEVQIMLDEIDECIEALEGSSATHLADIREKHMNMLLTRFNEYLTRPLI